MDSLGMISGTEAALSRASASSSERHLRDVLGAGERIKALMSGQEIPAESDLVELEKACRDFESIFLGYMLKEMRKSVQTSSLTEDSFGRRMYTSMFDEEVARFAASSGSLGIGDLVFESLTRSMKGGTEQENLLVEKETAKVAGLNLR